MEAQDLDILDAPFHPHSSLLRSETTVVYLIVKTAKEDVKDCHAYQVELDDEVVRE